MTVASSRSLTDDDASVMSMSNTIVAPKAAVTAMYPRIDTAYVMPRNSTARIAAARPVGSHTSVTADAITTPTQMPATRPTHRV